MIKRKQVRGKVKWEVWSDDGSKRLGGPYDTKKKAEERLQQIEFFKHRDQNQRRTGK